MSKLYKDGLIEVTDNEVVFHRYYFPFGGDKHVPLSQIESVQVRQPSIAFGSWRIWGGGPRTWFPLSVDDIIRRAQKLGFTLKEIKGQLARTGAFTLLGMAVLQKMAPTKKRQCCIPG
jgi:hypothetical protein